MPELVVRIKTKDSKCEISQLLALGYKGGMTPEKLSEDLRAGSYQ